MNKFYVVEYTRHNKTTDAWAFKSELGTDNKDEAEKKAHAIYAEFIGGDTFDHVNVIMKDNEGVNFVNLTWKATAEEPTVTE